MSILVCLHLAILSYVFQNRAEKSQNATSSLENFYFSQEVIRGEKREIRFLKCSTELKIMIYVRLYLIYMLLKTLFFSIYNSVTIVNR